MRAKNLKTLQNKKNKAEENLVKRFEQAVDEFKLALSNGVEITNTDELIAELGKIEGLSKYVLEFKEALSSLTLPEQKVKIEGLDDFISKIPTEINVEQLDLTELKKLFKSFEKLNTEIKGALVAPVDQAPDKYKPFRRVRKVGNVMVYDDSSWGGASGGGSGGSSLTQNDLNTSDLAKEAKQDTLIDTLTKYTRVPDLTFRETVAGGATYASPWVDASDKNWIHIQTEIPTTSIFSGTLRTSTAVDPDNPTADDIVQDSSVTLAGASLGGIDKASFGINGTTRWVRILATNATGSSHEIKVVSDYSNIQHNASLLPLLAVLKTNFLAPPVQAVLKAFKDDETIDKVTMTDDGFLRQAIAEHIVDTPIKALTGLQNTRVTVGTSAVRIDPSALTGRKTIAIKAITGTGEIVYIGHSNAVTTGNGWPLGNSDSVEYEIDETQQVWAIASAVSQSVAVSEVA